jgi:hypothetical protein
MRDMPAIRRLRLVLLIVAASTWASACLNLDDVASLTKAAEGARQTLPPVVNDWPASCDRINTILASIPTGERPATLQAQDCAPYKATAAHLLKDQAILIAYFDALGKLASNSLFTFDARIDTDISAVSAMPGLAQKVGSTTTAAQTLAKALADVATEGYRTHALNSLIVRNDAAVQSLANALKAIVTNDYVIQLTNEAEIMRAYYESPMEAQAKAERLVLLLVQRQYRADQSTLAAHKVAAETYGSVMDSLSTLHSKLKIEIERKASLTETAAAIGPYVIELAKAIRTLQQEIK